MILMFFYLIKLSPKRLSKNHIRDSMLTQNMCHLMKMIFLSHLSMLLISDGKLILANSKNIMHNMENIVKPSILLKPKLRKIPMLNPNLNIGLSAKCLSLIKTSLKLGMKLRNINNTQQLMLFQTINYQRILIGEMSMVLISQTNIEIKVTVVLATPFLSLKLQKWDLSWNMDKVCQHFHHNISWLAITWTKDAMVDGHSSMVSWLRMDIS